VQRSASDAGAAASAPYLTVFMIDGLSESVFAAEMQAGRLPEIAALAAGGAFVDHGISAFPSMTAYGFHPFLTGQDAARSGVLGLRWFDRSRDRGNLRSYVGSTQGLVNADRLLHPLSVYERVEGQHTFSVNTYANRGVRRSRRLGWSFSVAKFREASGPARLLAGVPLVGGALAPDWERAETRAMQTAIDDLDLWPKVQWITLSSPDGYAHVYGVDARYAALLRHADGLIGLYRRASQRLGQEPHRIYAVVSDHGVADARANLDLRAVLRRCCGLNVVRDSALRFRLSEPLSMYDGADGVLAINGDMMNYVYLRNASAPAGEEWRHPLGEAQLARYGARGADVIAGLLAEPGVELVVVRGDAPGRLVVRSTAGRGVIAAEAGGLAYRAEGEDPLGYAALGLADGVARTAAEWLEATHGAAFPDAPHRLSAVMANRDAGDLVVTSAPGYDLGADYEPVVDNYRGGHGGLRADQLRVPFVLSGRGVARGVRVPAARAEDVGATLLSLLDLPPEREADGVVLRPVLDPATAIQAR
jgi:arylsulfatase A-like enzyme